MLFKFADIVDYLCCLWTTLPLIFPCIRQLNRACITSSKQTIAK